MTDPDKKEANPKILPSQMKEGDFAHRTWSVIPGVAMTMDMLLLPETYAHINGKLRQGDHIEVTSCNGDWFVELLVRGADGDVQVGVLNKVVFEALPDRDVDAYEVEPVGNPGKWRVRRRTDNHIMIDGLDSKLKALQWIERPTRPKAAPQQIAA